MSGQKVDICGRIAHAADVLEAAGMGTVTVSDLRKAQKAFVELIEADREYDAAIEHHKELVRKVAEEGWFEIKHDALRMAGTRTVAAMARRQEALANIEGLA